MFFHNLFFPHLSFLIRNICFENKDPWTVSLEISWPHVISVVWQTAGGRMSGPGVAQTCLPISGRIQIPDSQKNLTLGAWPSGTSEEKWFLIGFLSS